MHALVAFGEDLGLKLFRLFLFESPISFHPLAVRSIQQSWCLRKSSVGFLSTAQALVIQLVIQLNKETKKQTIRC
jgi:hypothetical protein